MTLSWISTDLESVEDPSSILAGSKKVFCSLKTKFSAQHYKHAFSLIRVSTYINHAFQLRYCADNLSASPALKCLTIARSYAKQRKKCIVSYNIVLNKDALLMRAQRCYWCLSHPLYTRYHDEEWGGGLVMMIRCFLNFLF